MQCSFWRDIAGTRNVNVPPEGPSNISLASVESVWSLAMLDARATISVVRADFCIRMKKVKAYYNGPILIGADGASIEPSAQSTACVIT